MADAQQAIDFVISREDGFVYNMNDNGGATNFGLSSRFLRMVPEDRLRRYGIFGAVTIDVIKALTREQAEIIYKGEFWEMAPFGSFNCQYICNYVFDMCVQHGIAQGIKLLQRAMWAIKFRKGCLLDDGVLGQKTISAVNSLEEFDTLEKVLMAERAGFMRLCVCINPKDRGFLDGWLNRCYRV